MNVDTVVPLINRIVPYTNYQCRPVSQIHILAEITTVRQFAFARHLFRPTLVSETLLSQEELQFKN